LWRGTRDGFEASKFHQLCDGKPNTLTLIKSTTGYIFGGYTSIPWSNPANACYKADNTAFLFTLTNPNYNPLKLKVNANQNAVSHHSGYGPTFGSSYPRDLIISSTTNNDTSSYINFQTYQFPNGKSGVEGGKFFLGDLNSFKSAEIKVFQVI